MPITDRYGNALKQTEQKPTVQQSLDAWALLNELLELDYPHNFQHEPLWIVQYMKAITKVVSMAYEVLTNDPG